MNSSLHVNVLDSYLQNALKYLRDLDNPRKGVVVAALIDRGGVCYATSEQQENGLWLHAERNVIRSYIARYGSISTAAAIVISLSPCIVQNSNKRSGDSCTKLLLGLDGNCLTTPLNRIHTGIVDAKQADIDHYKKIGFQLTVTTNTVLMSACQKLYGYFSVENYGKASIVNYLDESLKDI
jgi:hypothetical protein